ncbi:hypothetical protein AruPA_05465 [Acidiphilium sp. PA]|uniref:hypothetical protein n=1 Tax=Acidiphilium sp. PA TaxID=2871705 RepID=UPI0022449E5B|nr:hypothetical protein [Acidiphilium sp. PA]MCW8306478.1 hypothetical protein [Acidiphilium sp. PA]
MVYTQVSRKPEMVQRRMKGARRRHLGGTIALLAVATLAGCATYDPLTAYHRYEGGVIGHNPPPAPGLDAKFPNLASVPAKPPVLSPTVQRAVRQQLLAANHHQNAMPVPGETPVVPPQPAPRAAVPPPPVLVGFEPNRAILSHRDRAALRALAARRAATPAAGAAPVVAMGFAPDRTQAGLKLALLRATAIGDALSAAGVPVSAIRIEALTAGRGGAAQLLYAGATE